HIPNYLILGRIGGGSYGEVYLAQTVTGRFRAVKVVRREDFEMERTFEREFEGIKHYEKVSQDHPGLVDVLHVGRDDAANFYWYVMELADDQSGETIDHIDPATYKARTLSSDLRESRQRDLNECIALGCGIAEALDHLHQSGLTHRDVKPANIIFVKGEPRLADIGLVAQSGQKTFVGTEGYVPPEGPGTGSADLYSLAMVLYEMQTGKDRLDFPELPTNHQLPPTVNRDEWRALNAVICRAGSPDPTKRFESGQAFSKALRRIRPGDFPGDPEVRETKKEFVVNKLLIGSSIAGLLLAVIVLSIVFWKGMMANDDTKDAPGPIEVAEEDIPETKKVVEEVKLPEIKPVIIAPLKMDEPEPIVASPVPKRSIKLDSVPSGATVWFQGREIGRTPIPYTEFDAGKLEFVFRKEGYLEKVESGEFDNGDSVLLRTRLIKDNRPAPGQTWRNAQNLEFFPAPEGYFHAPVTPYAYEGFLISTGRPLAVSAKEGIVQLSDKEAMWAFCDWMTGKDRSVGYLDKNQYHVPTVPPPYVPGKSFYCRVENGHSTLFIESSPSGAQIYEDDKLLGTTPAEITRRHGQFSLRVTLGGYREHFLNGFLRDDNLSIPVSLIRDRSVLFGEPWENSQGMPLVPMGDLMVASYETRIRDFAQFLELEPNPGVFAPEFVQTPDDPVVKVSRSDAELFCSWLTEKEQSEKLIRSWHRYRLPTDIEWSRLTGINDESGVTPKERERNLSGDFPWGTEWPPGSGTGNFADESGAGLFGKYIINEYRDGYIHTAPVGSFKPNQSNLYDLGGNVWEWVSDDYDTTSNLGVVRGGCWNSFEKGVLVSSYRNAVAPSERGEQYGFRYILVDTRESDE
ncbi:MAG: bifunctional serine/threonine-protein kinase/formylglycine-generating enzyme family protein, partial [Verrucomicrobiales bacterium]|nr:bifunctional serine/threonine-protein kinase/formylglycine-generating enzyme family protein [Verrucomicrobiales bacterium]